MSHGSPQKTPFTPTCPGMFCCKSCSNHHCLSNHITVYCSKMNSTPRPLPSTPSKTASFAELPNLFGGSPWFQPFFVWDKFGAASRTLRLCSRRWRVLAKTNDADFSPVDRCVTSDAQWISLEQKRGIRFVGLVEVKGRSPSPKRKVKGRHPQRVSERKELQGKDRVPCSQTGFPSHVPSWNLQIWRPFRGRLLEKSCRVKSCPTKNSSVGHIWLVICWYLKRTKWKLTILVRHHYTRFLISEKGKAPPAIEYSRSLGGFNIISAKREEVSTELKCEHSS